MRLIAERCPRCMGPTDRGYCGGCSAEFVTTAPACPRCGLPEPVGGCPRRGAARWLVDRVTTPYALAAPLNRQIHALKYRGARKLARPLGLLLAAALPAAALDVDALVPVPLHCSRRRERGYNQATEIARAVARETGLPLMRRGIERRRPTAAQTDLSADARAANLAGAFSAERNLSAARLMIVDDVLTTGATVNALALALGNAGAARVDVCAVARATDSFHGNGQPNR